MKNEMKNKKTKSEEQFDGFVEAYGATVETDTWLLGVTKTATATRGDCLLSVTLRLPVEFAGRKGHISLQHRGWIAAKQVDYDMARIYFGSLK